MKANRMALTATLMLAGLVTGCASTEQAMYRGGAGHDGVYADAPGPVEPIEPAWERATGARSYSSPMVTAERVYFGNSAGTLTAIDRASGGIVWTRELGSPIEAAPALAGDRVIVATWDGSVRAVKATSG